MHNIISDGIKCYLDKKYGENNYTVMTLGRSLSSVEKCLGYKIGEDNIKMVPMSLASHFCLNPDTDEDVESFRDYLNSIGLSKESIKKSDKALILADYSYTGQSLIGAKKIMQRDDVLGNETEIHIENVMDMLKDTDTEMLKKYGFDSKQKFLMDSEIIFWNSLYKKVFAC